MQSTVDVMFYRSRGGDVIVVQSTSSAPFPFASKRGGIGIKFVSDTTRTFITAA
jgi:hypothetical protein